MRRQLKPFVTEYRVSNRRSKEPSLRGEHDTARPAEADQDVFGMAPERTRADRFQTDGASGSYKAAMKAADALFAVRKPSPTHDAGETEAGPHATDPRASAREPGATAAARRILQVIEDPASHAQAQLSVPVRAETAQVDALQEAEAVRAEPAPIEVSVDEPAARRGRKPGSKNKPKPVAMSTLETPVEAVVAVAAPPATLTEVDMTADHRQRRDPFPWVRTRLRPGEKWKRRLPKVAW